MPPCVLCSSLTLLELPDEALARIAARLDQPSRASLAACCRGMLATSQRSSNSWWEGLAVRLLSQQDADSLSAWLARHLPGTRVLDLTVNFKSTTLPVLPTSPRECSLLVGFMGG